MCEREVCVCEREVSECERERYVRERGVLAMYWLLLLQCI